MVSNHTILLVDDDVDDLKILEEALKITGDDYRLLKALNGQEALQALAHLLSTNVIPCLIVMDMNMPKLNGRETFERIRANTRFAAVPIVMFSTSAKDHDRAFFLDHHTNYFVKPIHFNRLVAIARSMVTLCQQHSKAGAQ